MPIDTVVTPAMARGHVLAWNMYSSRGLYKPYRHNSILCHHLMEILAGRAHNRLIIQMPPQHGKQVADDTQVLTCNGFKKHGDLSVGDCVFAPDGYRTEVTAVLPACRQDCRVHFTDGSHIDCHENHEWVVYCKTNGKVRTYETKHLERLKLWSGECGKRGSKALYRLPYRNKIAGCGQGLLIDPYVLGVWLGDGKSCTGSMCFAATDREPYEWAVTHGGFARKGEWIHETTGVHYATVGGLTHLLRQLDLLNNKHIPVDYLIADVESRLDLLAGLMDTDGYFYHRNGRGTFSTSSERLAHDVAMLIHGLGWRSTISYAPPDCRNRAIQGKRGTYQVTFNADCVIPCRIPRKLDSQRISDQRGVCISHVERVRPTDGRCISVAGGMYLVGESLLPTHNSTTTTEGLSTYLLGCNPDKRVGICSHTADLAEDFGYRNRMRMLDSGTEVFGVQLDPVRKSKGSWGLAGHPNGGMVSVGVGGGLTGIRLDALICDDLIKNYEDAQSALVRDSVWNWLVTVAMTRLSKHAPVIVIGTRWHPDDHIGRLIRQSQVKDGHHFDVISMPAIAVQDELMPDGSHFRSCGEPLCPELHPLEKLAEIKKYMTPFQWSALYQQDPSTPGGCHWSPDLFNERVIIDDWPQGIKHLVIALDPSSGRDQKHGDYPAVCALGTRGDGYFYLDFLMERSSPNIIAQNVARYVLQLKQQTGCMPQLLGVEKIGLWELYAERLIKEFARNGHFIPICEVSHQSRDKTLRIQRVDPYIANREVRFIRSLGTMIALDQFRDFPLGKHDDACDAAEMAFRILPRVAMATA